MFLVKSGPDPFGQKHFRHRSVHVLTIQLISFINCCLSAAMSISVVSCLPNVFQTLLYWLAVDFLQCSPSIFCSIVLLIFSRLASTHVHFRSVCRPSSVTYAQAILIASVSSCWNWSLLCPLCDRFVCDTVFFKYINRIILLRQRFSQASSRKRGLQPPPRQLANAKLRP